MRASGVALGCTDPVVQVAADQFGKAFDIRSAGVVQGLLARIVACTPIIHAADDGRGTTYDPVGNQATGDTMDRGPRVHRPSNAFQNPVSCRFVVDAEVRPVGTVDAEKIHDALPGAIRLGRDIFKQYDFHGFPTERLQVSFDLWSETIRFDVVEPGSFIATCGVPRLRLRCEHGTCFGWEQVYMSRVGRSGSRSGHASRGATAMSVSNLFPPQPFDKASSGKAACCYRIARATRSRLWFERASRIPWSAKYQGRWAASIGFHQPVFWFAGVVS